MTYDAQAYVQIVHIPLLGPRDKLLKFHVSCGEMCGEDKAQKHRLDGTGEIRSAPTQTTSRLQVS